MPVTARASINAYPSGRVAISIRPQVARVTERKVNRTVQAAKSYAPVRTGRLKRSIFSRARNSAGRFVASGSVSICSYEIVVAVPYAGFVTRGTKPHIIRSKGPWPLRNPETGQVFGRVVRHPGTRPNDYLQRALRTGMQA